MTAFKMASRAVAAVIGRSARVVRRSAIAAMLLLATLVGTAHSQSVAPDAHPVGPKGGVVADAGPYHVELLFTKGALLAYLYEGDNRPVAAGDVKASAQVLAGGQQYRIPLVPIGANGLSGEAKLPPDPEAKCIVFLDIPGQRRLQARFVVAIGPM